MNAVYGRRRPLLTVLVLLAISILLDRYLVAALLPWISSLGGISLMVVFLDIPVALPLIDPLPVAVLFSLFYSMLPSTDSASGRTIPPVGKDDSGRGSLSDIWGGVIVLACWMAAGALVYHFTQTFLPRQVRNGIDSFGVHADIYTPFTAEYSILHLRGGFILLLCFIIGGRILVKRINRAAIAHPVPGMILPEMEIPAEPAKTIRSRIPEPQLQRTNEPFMPMAAEPIRPRAAAKSVSIVAPLRVEVLEKESATPLY